MASSRALRILLIWSLGAISLLQAASGTWSLTGSMSTARYDHTATLLPDGRVLVSGGASGSGRLASAEIYDPALGTWSLTGSMSTARNAHTATLLSDGRVLVSGGDSRQRRLGQRGDLRSGAGHLVADGLDEHGPLLPHGHSAVRRPGARQRRCTAAASLASAEIYDPALGTWSLTGSMSTARHSTRPLCCQTAGCLSAAVSRQRLLASAEIYDPALGTWSLTGSMSTARSSTRPRCCQTAGCSSAAVATAARLLGQRGDLRSGAGHLVADGLDEHCPLRPHGHAAARRPGARQRRHGTAAAPWPARRSTIRRWAPGR